MSLILQGIDLPQEEINLTITKDGRIYLDNKYHLIAEAVQVPKNHGNLKDIDVIYRAFSRCAENETDEGRIGVYAQLMRLLLQAPTVLEEEEEGSWIPVDSYSAFGGDEATWEAHGNPIAYHYCSKCKNQVNVNEFGEELLTDYCPYCGARMKGE